MAKANKKIEGIIQAATLASAKIGSSQELGHDYKAIVPLQTGMIMAIANEHGKTITREVAAELLKTFAAKMEERYLYRGSEGLMTDTKFFSITVNNCITVKEVNNCITVKEKERLLNRLLANIRAFFEVVFSVTLIVFKAIKGDFMKEKRLPEEITKEIGWIANEYFKVNKANI